MARTNKQEENRITKFKAELVDLINEKGLDVNDFNFDQDSDSLEQVISNLKAGGADNDSTNTSGAEGKAEGSQAQEHEAQATDSAEEKTDNAEATARQEAEVEVGAEREYRNTGSTNLFTASGRCRPNAVIVMTAEEAGIYPALELCGTDDQEEA